MDTPRKPLWAGRLSGELHQAMRRLNASIGFDRRLAREDVEGSRAYARALARAGVIAEDEARRIIEGLDAIEREIAGGTFPFREDLEDIHMNVEARLAERIGPVAGKIHTGRSRNDQVATDLRLHLRRKAGVARRMLLDLAEALADRAASEIETIVPAYTHLQRAQPILYAHQLLAYAEMLRRDADRFRAAARAADVLPLGSGACAGSPFGVDREFLREALGFRDVSRNSLDAVSDRDFVLDFLYAASVLAVHLSRLAEDFILASSEEFGFIELDDAVSTGSSMLPHKRNPDACELARGKAGRVIGHLVALLTVLKGLPLSYNRDLQEDKEPVFDTIDTIETVLAVLAVAVRTMRIRRDRIAEGLSRGHLEAMGLADLLVRNGVPFREAHHAVAELVRIAAGRGCRLADLDPEVFRQVRPEFGDDPAAALDLRSSIEARDSTGGTATARVREEIGRLREWIRTEREDDGET